MTTEELEQLLKDLTETQNIDFKESCPWNIDTFAKDILAFANVKDGGYIIIGVEEVGPPVCFVRKGTTQDHIKTYIIDTMRDQFAKYADPSVNFKVSFPKGKDGLSYIVISIAEFDEIPIICVCKGYDIKQSTIYYRNRNKKVESAAVSNANDLRDIVERASYKLMRKTSKAIPVVTKTENEVKKNIIFYENENKGL